MTAATKDTPTKVAVKLGPIGPTIDKMNDLRERKRELEAQVKTVEDEYAALEELLMAKMDAEGTNKAAGKKASVSISESVVGNVTDWDAFNEFARKKNFMHLYQRRLSDPAIRELFEKGTKIPGCEPFTKRRLNLRSGV